MTDKHLRHQLLAMRAEDLRIRQELMASGELGDSYAPRMEEVHGRNAARLRELIGVYGWPAEDVAGKDGSEAAWLVAQQAIGEPEFQRESLRLLRACAAEGRVPVWQAAYLEDRIAMYEGRPQRYGTQWLDDAADGRARPWRLEEPMHVNELRAEVGLEPMRPIPERGRELSPDHRQQIEDNQRWWEEWLASRGWPRSRSKAATQAPRTLTSGGET
jgi:hypothetical protein